MHIVYIIQTHSDVQNVPLQIHSKLHTSSQNFYHHITQPQSLTIRLLFRLLAQIALLFGEVHNQPRHLHASLIGRVLAPSVGRVEAAEPGGAAVVRGDD